MPSWLLVEGCAVLASCCVLYLLGFLVGVMLAYLLVRRIDILTSGLWVDVDDYM